MDNFQLVSITKISGNPTTIILLKNKKDIAVCTTNGFLLIYNIKLFKQKLCKEIINNDIVNNIQNKKTILDIIELQENNYCISCWDFKLRIIELRKNNTECNIIQTLTDHKSYIFFDRLIQLLCAHDRLLYHIGHESRLAALKFHGDRWRRRSHHQLDRRLQIALPHIGFRGIAFAAGGLTVYAVLITA